MIAAIITQSGEILYSPLHRVIETEPVDMEAPGTELGEAYEAATEQPTPTPGVPVVGLTADRTGCVELINGVVIGASSAFDSLSNVAPEDFTITQWFNDATLARFESPWQDLSSPAQFKNLHEVELTFDRDSRAYVGVCVENERGHRRFRWCGVTHGRTKPLRAAVNIMGVRFRVRVCMVVFNDARVILRDMRLGFTVGGAD